MIRREEVFKIGIINRPHGVKGEISFTFTDDIFDRVECDYLILSLEGILVPFFIEEYRFRSNNVALVKFEDVNTSEQARKLTNTEVYFPKKYMDGQAENFSWNFFTGFRVEDMQYGYLGEITDVDDTTQNVLFVIKKDGKECLLPAHDEFIIDLDRERNVLKVNVPDGLIDS